MLSISRTGAATALFAGSALLLSGCLATSPTASTAPASTGAAGGGMSVGADSSLQTCVDTVGTVRLQDGQATVDARGRATGDPTVESIRGLLSDLNGYAARSGDNRNGVTIESLRLLIQQSNCLVVAERGIGESGAIDEKRRTRSPNSEVRDDANMGPGQEVAADFVLRAMVVSVNANENASSINVGALLPWKMAQGLSAGKSISSADVQLVLSDVRANIQLAVAQGHGEGSNTSLATNVLGRFGGAFGAGQAKTGSNTSTAKVLLQAYAEAYNKLVPALKNYKTQTVKGGLGAGGTLRVQGNKVDPSSVQK